jgi:hypothetical protein
MTCHFVSKTALGWLQIKEFSFTDTFSDQPSFHKLHKLCEISLLLSKISLCASKWKGNKIHELSLKHILQDHNGFSTDYVHMLILIFPKNKLKNVRIGFHSVQLPIH